MSGQPAAAHRLLTHVQRAFLTAEGDFEPRAALLHTDIARLYANSYVILAGWFERQERIDEAIEVLKRAIAVKPDLAAAHHDLGVLILKQGRVQEAIQSLRTAVRLAPGFASAHNILGLALLANRDYEESIASIIEAIRDAHSAGATVLTVVAAMELVFTILGGVTSANTLAVVLEMLGAIAAIASGAHPHVGGEEHARVTPLGGRAGAGPAARFCG